MRKKVTIEVDIDTEKPGTTGMQGNLATPNLIKIEVRKDAGSFPHDTPEGSLAHELGHAIATIFNLPEFRDDPRTSTNRDTLRYRMYGPDSDMAQRVYNHEKLAWDFARVMLPGMDQREVEDSLRDYRRDIKTGGDR